MKSAGIFDEARACEVEKRDFCGSGEKFSHGLFEFSPCDQIRWAGACQKARRGKVYRPIRVPFQHSFNGMSIVHTAAQWADMLVMIDSDN